MRELQACVPATTGLANARSLARMYAGLSMDGVWPSDTTSCNSETGSEDLFFVSPEAIRTFSEVQVEGVDRILCLPARFSEGFQVSLPDPLFSFGLSPGSFGHAGSGWSLHPYFAPLPCSSPLLVCILSFSWFQQSNEIDCVHVRRIPGLR